MYYFYWKQSSNVEINSAKKILNGNVPKIDPCVTRNITSSQSLNELFILVLCFLFDRLWTSLNSGMLQPWAFSFAMIKSWSSQSKTLNKYIVKALNTLALSSGLFHSLLIPKGQWSNLFYSHIFFKNIFSQNWNICLNRHVITGKMLVGV